MRVLKKDLKHGIVRLQIQNPSDVWYLSKIIKPGDIVKAKTTRRMQIKRGQEVVKGERISVVLSLKAEKIDFEHGKIKIFGLIVEGPESIGKGHHSFLLGPGDSLEISKEWKKHDLLIIDKAARQEPKLLICVLDREEASFATIQATELKMLGTSRFRLEEEQRKEWYEELYQKLKDTECDAIIIAGPGFEYENLFRFVKEKDPKFAKKISLQKANSTGKTGINEVIKRAKDVLAKTQIAVESEIVEMFFAEIAKEGLAVYGRKETEKAVSMGAVDTLLVSDEVLHENEDLLKEAENLKAKIVVISSKHEAGERFLSLGGVGALLRFRIP